VTAPTGAKGRAAYRAAESGGISTVIEASPYQALLRDLRANFMMLVVVPYEPGAQHLFKLDWTDAYQWRASDLGGWARATGASMGLVDQKVRIADLEVGAAVSTHFEIVRPDDVNVLSATLTVDRDGVGPQTVGPAPQINLNAAVADPRDPLTSRADRGEISIRMRPSVDGAFLAILVLCTLTAVALWTLGAHLGDLDAQTTSAVILLLPAVGAAYLVRQGEHAIAGRLLAGVRISGLLVAGMAFIAALMIGVGDGSAAPADVACDGSVFTLGEQPRPAPFFRWHCEPPVAGRPAQVDDTTEAALYSFAGISAFLTLLLGLGFVQTRRALDAAERSVT
jgi:hypothetical protein